jgi:hypothetical protein
MLITVSSATGMDVEFKDLQQFLHSRLLTAWSIDTSLYHSYGRCYRNRKEKGYVAEVYIGNKEYKEVYWNDSLAAISFMGLSEKIGYENHYVSDAHLVFFVNLDRLKPTLAHRADEEVRWDVVNIVSSAPGGFSFKGITLGLENILKEYPGSITDELQNKVEMHPVHCFRLDLELTYDNNNINRPLKSF